MAQLANNQKSLSTVYTESNRGDTVIDTLINTHGVDS